MKRGLALILFFVILIPLANSMSLKDLIAKYVFTSSTVEMNITDYTDFMIDGNNDEINDTLVFELRTSNKAGSYIFAVNLFDKNGILTNETNKSLNAGANKLNLTFPSAYLSKNQFNYSIKIFNSSYSLKYRKDNLLTQTYSNYDEGFKILSIDDNKIGKTLKIKLRINSSINLTSEASLFLKHNNSIISSRNVFSINSSMNDLEFNFDNETIKKTHYAGIFNLSSIKIGKKILKPGFATGNYDFRDFASSSYFSAFSDENAANARNKYASLKINAEMQIAENNDYVISLGLYDLFGNIIEIKNASYFLAAGKNIVSFDFNGSGIHDKKLSGPFVLKYMQLFENGKLIDNINDAYMTKNYNFNDFESANLPDLAAEISVSDGYHYGLNNITVNFTFKNIGSRHAFNVFTEIFNNSTFSKVNKSNILKSSSRINYQFNFVNVSDVEFTSLADPSDIIEESDENNNGKKVLIKINKKPVLAAVNNITVNETDRIILNLSAYDANADNIAYSINLSKFSNNSNNSNIFEWQTKTTDSGDYTLLAAASDGYLNDSFVFKIEVLDVPEKDADNDGINDSVDRLIGDENSVNTSTVNLSIFLNNSNNLSKLFDDYVPIKILEGNSTIAEFDFNFSLDKLNLANLTINKQPGNSTGYMIFRGLIMPKGKTKTLYVDRLNSGMNGICIKDEEILEIGEISGSCNLNNEFKIECDGTQQNSYSCIYNSTLNKYKIQGLKHSGIIQYDYKKPTDSGGSQSSGSSGGSSSGGSSSGGGGGGTACNSNWQCSEWSECIYGFVNRKCDDKNKCNTPTGKPLEIQKCQNNIKNGMLENQELQKENYKMADDLQILNRSNWFSGITGAVISQSSAKPNHFGIIVVLAAIIIILGFYFNRKHSIFSKMFK